MGNEVTEAELLALPVREFSGAIWMEDDDLFVMRDNGEAWCVYTHDGKRVRTRHGDGGAQK